MKGIRLVLAVLGLGIEQRGESSCGAPAHSLISLRARGSTCPNGALDPGYLCPPALAQSALGVARRSGEGGDLSCLAAFPPSPTSIATEPQLHGFLVVGGG